MPANKGLPRRVVAETHEHQQEYSQIKAFMLTTPRPIGLNSSGAINRPTGEAR
jgi:hypothetical protein